MLDPGGLEGLGTHLMNEYREVFFLLGSSQGFLSVLLVHGCTEWKNKNKNRSFFGGELKKAGLLPHDSPSWL